MYHEIRKQKRAKKTTFLSILSSRLIMWNKDKSEVKQKEGKFKKKERLWDIIPQMWKHYNDILTNKQKSLSLASPFTGETERGKDSTGMEQEKKNLLPPTMKLLFSFVNWKCDNNDILLLE